MPLGRILLQAALRSTFSVMTEPIRRDTRINPRSIGRKVELAPPKPGFLGQGHLVVEVVTPSDLVATDPFVLLMDDRVDYPKGQALGDAHPHAGLETVTFVVDAVVDAGGGTLRSGDVIWMTAGSGVVHGGEFRAPGGPMRFLQLWLTLPERERAAAPRFAHLPAAEMPVFRGSGVEARLYSGSTNGLTSATLNHVAVTLVDVRLEPGAVFEQQLPPRYNGFLYPLAGSVLVAGANTDHTLNTEQVGWLDQVDEAVPSVLRVVAGPEGARVLLYCGERQNEPAVQKGPFVAGSLAAIEQMHLDYRAGHFVRTAAPL
jgi:quercetin 2,3-dioxygenase